MVSRTVKKHSLAYVPKFELGTATELKEINPTIQISGVHYDNSLASRSFDYGYSLRLLTYSAMW